MAGEIRANGEAADAGGDGPAQPWPKSRTAWYAVSVFALALMFLFLDSGIITLLGQPIKTDLGLSDFRFGLLAGPALIFIDKI